MLLFPFAVAATGLTGFIKWYVHGKRVNILKTVVVVVKGWERDGELEQCTVVTGQESSWLVWTRILTQNNGEGG